MSDKPKNGLTVLPDLSNKLTNPPSKKSLFERQKAEAEAKRVKAEQETAAVYEDFVKSFDHDGENDELLAAVGHGGGGRGGGATGIKNDKGNTASAGGAVVGKRHFSTRAGKSSGPGSLGPGPNLGMRKSGPGSLGPVPTGPTGYRGLKRSFNGPHGEQADEQDRDVRMLSSHNRSKAPLADVSTLNAATAFATDVDEEVERPSEEKAVPKPTLHLCSLPPGASPSFIKSLILSKSVTVEHVKILSAGQSGQSTTARRTTSAIVTLPTDTPAAEIDSLVSHLQNKYLGFGCYLSISRHLSSAAIGSGGVSAPSSTTTNLPFGARAVPQQNHSLSRGAPPPGLGGRRGKFAPPTTYTSSTPYSQRDAGGREATTTQVVVNPPSDLKQLKLIHLTVEALLNHGPSFEALLMTRREVQREEKWAWLWDARSRGGVYYRWRLWAICTGAEIRHNRKTNGEPAHFLFERSAPWIPPDVGLKFEYTTKLEDLVEDEAYDSSDEEDYDDEAKNLRRRRADQLAEGMSGSVGGGIGGDPSATDTDGSGYLNPMAKAKLVHLLARLPDGSSKLRRGDVARVAAFAIEHAGEGAGEVAAIITANVRQPLCFTSANPDRSLNAQQQLPQQRHEQAFAQIDRKKDEAASAIDSSTSTPTPPPLPIVATHVPAAAATMKPDITPASLVTLYVISDILMSSTTSGVRHAWRYRALFESSLASQRIFQFLGAIDRELGWGRLKAEKWKRSVQTLLGLWEGWCVFPQNRHEEFVKAFVEQPPSGREDKGVDARQEGQDQKGPQEGAGAGAGGKWRSVQDKDTAMRDGNNDGDDDDNDNLDGRPMSEDEDGDNGRGHGLDGRPMSEGDDNDDEMIDQADLDGVPMVDSSDQEDEEEEEEGKEGKEEEKIEARADLEKSKQSNPQNSTKELGQEYSKSQSHPTEETSDKTTKIADSSTNQHQPPPRERERERPKAVDMFAEDSE